MSFILVSGVKQLDLRSPKVMGILNATPDSFFKGSRIRSNSAEVVDAAGAMLEAGASILDIGGQSTRPGSETVSAEEELDRVYPIIEQIRSTFRDAWISLDTYYASVVRGCSDLGIDIVNDISAGEDDPDMLGTVASGGWIYIAMHKLGKPKWMQDNPTYLKPIQEELLAYFTHKLETITSAGIHQWMIDPGFGFGKTIDHNYQLLKNLSYLRTLNTPILVGISRKSMIYKLLNISADDALNGSSVLHFSALQQGANILRVHDVKEAVETIALFNKLQEV